MEEQTPKGKRFFEMTKEELSQCGKVGAKKSAETRKKNRSMKLTLQALLSMPLKSGKLSSVEEVKNFANLQGKNLTTEEAIMIKAIQRALKGDLASMQFIRDTSGQKPDDNLNVTEIKPVVISGEDDLE